MVDRPSTKRARGALLFALAAAVVLALGAGLWVVGSSDEGAQAARENDSATASPTGPAEPASDPADEIETRARPVEIGGVGSDAFVPDDDGAGAVSAQGQSDEEVRAELKAFRKHLAALEKTNASLVRQLRTAPVTGSFEEGSGELSWPVNGPVTSPFGQRWGRLHAGIDIGAGSGTPIQAADRGQVVLLGSQGGYGNLTCVQHTGSLSTCYAHQSRYGTELGATVDKGEVIGFVGCTGNCYGDHLHFEVRLGGSAVDPLGYL